MFAVQDKTVAILAMVLFVSMAIAALIMFIISLRMGFTLETYFDLIRLRNPVLGVR